MVRHWSHAGELKHCERHQSCTRCVDELLGLEKLNVLFGLHWGILDYDCGNFVINNPRKCYLYLESLCGVPGGSRR